MRALRPVLVGFVALGLTVSVVGCGSASDPAAGSGSPTSTSDVPAPTGDAAITQDGEPVKPGTGLKYGEAVTIPVKEENGDEGDYTAHLRIAVTDVKPGQVSDLQTLADPSKYAGKSPVYVYTDVEVVDITGGDENTVIKIGYGATTSGDSLAQPLVIFGSYEGPLCAGGTSLQASKLTDGGVLAAGMKTTDCAIFLVDEGEEIESISYNNKQYTRDSGDPYRSNPIVWSD